MKAIIEPGLLNGEVVIPPSKSLSHRAIIAAGLACGRSVISNVMYSQDIIATIKAIKAIGATVVCHEDYLEVYGSNVKRARLEINANESGSTLRFMIPIALISPLNMVFKGENNLVNRPLDSYFEIFDEFNIKYKHPKDAYLPLETFGGLHAGVYKIRGDISSQFITGLLYALPLLPGDSKIVITSKLESKGYIDLTLDVLSQFGINIINKNYEEFIIEGFQTFKPHDYVIEGDYSQSAFFLVAGALGSDIMLKAMNPSSFQGDKKILSDVRDFKGIVNIFGNSIKAISGDLKGAVIDFSQSPDLAPALTLLACLSKGKSEFINASRLRIKECDRITAMREELNKMGADIIEKEDGMIINGVKELRGCVVDSHNDHRVCMTLAIAASIAKSPTTILDAECVSKSYPDFWDVFKKLGGNVRLED